MNSENTAKETILACFFIGYICLLETKTWWSLFIPLLVVVVLDLLIWDFLPYLKKKCKQRREKILFSNSKEGYFINYQYFYLHYKRDEVSAKEIKQFLSFYQGPVLGFMAHIQGDLIGLMVVLSSMKHRGLQKVFSLGNQQGSYDYSSECFLVVEKHCFHLPAPSSGVPQVFQEINLFVVEKLEDIFLWPNYQSTLPKYSIVVSPKKEGRGGLLIEKITVAGKNLLWVQIPPLHGNFTDKRRSLDYVYISTKKIRFGRAFVYAD